MSVKIFCKGEPTLVSELKPHPKNPNTHPPEQVQLLAKVIEKNGFRAPIVVSLRSGFITKGHGRWEAAKFLGAEIAPVDFQDYASESEELADMVADNKIAELAAIDDVLFNSILNELREKGVDLELAGILDGLLDQEVTDESPTGKDVDDVPEPEAKPVSAVGDVWQMGPHRIICGDSENPEVVAELLQGEVPKMMVTDPPYGVNYEPNWRKEVGYGSHKDLVAVKNDHRSDWTKAWQLFPGAIAYIWHAGVHTHTVAQSLTRARFKLEAQVIWNKKSLTLGRGDYHWKHEPCWVASREENVPIWDKYHPSVWNIDKEKFDQGHGTQKPVECMRRPLLLHTKRDDLIYEPFSGSGTTVVACETSSRVCYAIELNPVCVDITVRRWQEFTGQKATNNNGKHI